MVARRVAFATMTFFLAMLPVASKMKLLFYRNPKDKNNNKCVHYYMQHMRDVHRTANGKCEIVVLPIVEIRRC